MNLSTNAAARRVHENNASNYLKKFGYQFESSSRYPVNFRIFETTPIPTENSKEKTHSGSTRKRGGHGG